MYVTYFLGRALSSQFSLAEFCDVEIESLMVIGLKGMNTTDSDEQ
jgi:hypothetical protein